MRYGDSITYIFKHEGIEYEFCFEFVSPDDGGKILLTKYIDGGYTEEPVYCTFIDFPTSRKSLSEICLFSHVPAEAQGHCQRLVRVLEAALEDVGEYDGTQQA